MRLIIISINLSFINHQRVRIFVIRYEYYNDDIFLILLNNNEHSNNQIS